MHMYTPSSKCMHGCMGVHIMYLIILYMNTAGGMLKETLGMSCTMNGLELGVAVSFCTFPAITGNREEICPDQCFCFTKKADE